MNEAMLRRDPRMSVIIPTCGRARLQRTLESLAENGALVTDDVIVVGDGEQPGSRRIVEAFPKDRLTIRYFEHGPRNTVGNAQRNFAMPLAVGTHLAFLDDDDECAHGGMTAIRETVADNPGRPLIFREESRTARHPWGVVWVDHVLRSGNVGTQGIVVPNVPAMLGRWGEHYCGDFEFARSTVDLYPNKDRDIVWVDKIVAYLY